MLCRLLVKKTYCMTYDEHSPRVVQLTPLLKLYFHQVKARAEQAGSSSMVYLANTLRHVVKAVHCLMAAQALTSSEEGAETLGAAVVVEFTPLACGGDGTLHVRIALSEDGAVPP